jgi:hypothetical protein
VRIWGPIHDYTTRASAIDLECDKEGPFCDTAIHDTFAIKGDKDRVDATGDEGGGGNRRKAAENGVPQGHGLGTEADDRGGRGAVARLGVASTREQPVSAPAKPGKVRPRISTLLDLADPLGTY